MVRTRSPGLERPGYATVAALRLGMGKMTEG
jgi:hypothetical protein